MQSFLTLARDGGGAVAVGCDDSTSTNSKELQEAKPSLRNE
jgi:hypothetical protein